MKNVYIMCLLVLGIISCNESTTKKDNKPIVSPYYDIVKKKINPPTEYKPLGVMEGDIRDLSFAGIKRFSINIVSQELIEDIDSEARYWLWYVWQKHNDAKAISVLFFVKKEKIAYNTADFAPYGDWSKASTTSEYWEYKVNIN